MSKSLSLLSGKGGSGKTTLALSIASLLSRCNLKVLLVDCDLSTNGATYFYEDKLPENANSIDSFYRLFFDNTEKQNRRRALFSCGKTELRLIKINEYADFMPSITKIENRSLETHSQCDMMLDNIHSRLKSLYDVIIFDCQAGYTDSLESLLPYTDVNLVVMEADAISSAALRSLYLKTGFLLSDKKMYQVFNKATDEEYEIYSKISGGTVFTNIETVRFDWRIRKAFSTAQIPDMESTSARYGEQVFHICKTLFKEERIQNGLEKFETVIQINRIKEREAEIKNSIDLSYSSNKKTPRLNIGFIAYIAAIVILVIVSVILDELRVFSNESVWLPVVLVSSTVLLVGVEFISFSSSMAERRARNKRFFEILDELDELKATRMSLEKQLENEFVERKKLKVRG